MLGRLDLKRLRDVVVLKVDLRQWADLNRCTWKGEFSRPGNHMKKKFKVKKQNVCSGDRKYFHFARA